MADIFISYARKDEAFVRQLHQALVENGFDVWVDVENIPLSAEWWHEIRKGIEIANVFLFIVSPDSLGSEVCDPSHLLRGNNLNEAETWLAASVDKDPTPTLVQTQYIRSSRVASTRRQRNIIGALALGIVVTLALAFFALVQRQAAINNEMAASDDNQVIVWNPDDEEPIRRYTARPGKLFTPDLSNVLSLRNEDHSLTLMDIESGELRQRFEGRLNLWKHSNNGARRTGSYMLLPVRNANFTAFNRSVRQKGVEDQPKKRVIDVELSALAHFREDLHYQKGSMF